MGPFTFSFIIPTRGRSESLRMLCHSIHSNTSNPDALEIVLVVDSDDPSSIEFSYPGLNIRHAHVAPGMTMGDLNMTGYRVATGEYLMLLNDDMILRTPRWDERVLEVFRGYPDGIVLAHVNDTIFGEKLCTFPFLTRAFCELAGGICPTTYKRYRIDDHIHNVFDLLMLLGHRRRVFLPEIIFEHHNVTDTQHGQDYVPNPEIHVVDTRLFDALLPERKRLAVEAMERIARHRRSEERLLWEQRLESVNDSVAIRHPHHCRYWPVSHASVRPRVTVAVVSADAASDLTRKCVDAVKAHTRDFDLVIVDNNRSEGFNHPREMNRLLEFCRTDYLVLMDDDVFVEEGWLEGMLRAMEPDVGVVTPVHYDAQGRFSYAGVVLQPDDSGHHTHVMTIGDRPQNIQTLCSAIMLIDMARCGRVRLDERYSKYFLDIDYGLRIWEAGFRVVCSPWTRVTHIGGGTMTQGGSRSVELFEQQRRAYVRLWVATRRIHALQRGIWKAVPEFVELSMLQREVDALFLDGPRCSKDAFFSRALTVFGNLENFPALKNYAAHQAQFALSGRFPLASDPETGYLAVLIGLSGRPVLFEAGVKGMNIVLWKSCFYALPADEGVFDADRIRRGGYSRSYEADSLEGVRRLITSGKSNRSHVSEGESQLTLAQTGNVSVVAVIKPPAGPPSRRATWKRLLRSLPYAGVLRPRGKDGADNLFDSAYYLATYPDVARAGVNPLLHFIVSGAFEGRSPHPLFDTAFYLRKYPDVAAAGVNPLGHFLKHGAAEGRQPHPLFDSAFYLQSYPDVRRSGVNPLVHYCRYGAAEGRQPHPWFDPQYYVNRCPKAAGENPLIHFVRSRAECWYPHPSFDCTFYLRENPDVARSGMNPLLHYVLFGATAGRPPAGHAGA